MVIVNMHQAKSELSALLQAVERGEWVRICRNGKPIADLVPVRRTKDPLKQNARLSDIRFNDDPTLPLSQEDWPEAYR